MVTQLDGRPAVCRDSCRSRWRKECYHVRTEHDLQFLTEPVRSLGPSLPRAGAFHPSAPKAFGAEGIFFVRTSGAGSTFPERFVCVGRSKLPPRMLRGAGAVGAIPAERPKGRPARATGLDASPRPPCRVLARRSGRSWPVARSSLKAEVRPGLKEFVDNPVHLWDMVCSDARIAECGMKRQWLRKTRRGVGPLSWRGLRIWGGWQGRVWNGPSSHRPANSERFAYVRLMGEKLLRALRAATGDCKMHDRPRGIVLICPSPATSSRIPPCAAGRFGPFLSSRPHPFGVSGPVGRAFGPVGSRCFRKCLAGG